MQSGVSNVIRVLVAVHVHGRLLLESAIFCAPLLAVLGACPLSRRFSPVMPLLPISSLEVWICVCV